MLDSSIAMQKSSTTASVPKSIINAFNVEGSFEKSVGKRESGCFITACGNPAFH